MSEKNAKRGYVPEDDKNFSQEAIHTLQKAACHVQYLINEGYDLKQASTFVGNHFQLSERQRLSVVRSVATDDQIIRRRRKEISLSNLSGKDVMIDGFNSIITLEVMLCEGILFECMDGTIRDLAALRGTYRIIPETEDAIRMMFEILQKADIRKAIILLDEPVSNSGRLKSLMAGAGEDYCFDLDIRVIRDVDRSLYEKENVITTDSIILDHCISWINLVSECMKNTGNKGINVWRLYSMTRRNGVEESPGSVLIDRYRI